MALLFMDGFDVNDLATKGWVGGLDHYATGRFGGKAAVPGQNTILKKTITASAKVIVGGAWFVDTMLDANQSMLMFWGDAGATVHLALRAYANGSFKLYLGDAGTLLATSATGLYVPNIWRYLEMSATIADAGGRVTVKIDGSTIIDFTGDTKNGGTNTTIDTVGFGNNGTFQAYGNWDDLYVCNDSGSANNAFLGDVRVQTLYPTGAGSSTQFTPTGVANNWDNVNDTPYSTATYNADSVPGHRDTYAMADLVAGTGTVFGVQDNILALKSDAGAASIKAAIKSGGTVYYDSALTLSASATESTALREVDPATSAAWTPANVNSLEFGAEIV